MPHFGLMDENGMQPFEAALLRARLHVRCGRRRLVEGKYPEGLSTIYDALLSGMRWFALKNDVIHEELHKRGDFILEDDEKLHELLAENGAWPEDLDFNKLQSAVYAVLEEKPEEIEPSLVLSLVEEVLTKLGVIPFNEKELPPEDPETF